ncbi:unnamed protein product [Durusdinium trenchii]|uniref:Uncharacterized protein n=1 Tax=Durusdinium trenchii TaxID=1381693 RepID=A0ABP0PAK8_9DINO
MTIEDFEPSSSNPSGIYGQTCNMLIFRPNTRATGSVCEQVVQSSFPKPHELDSIRKTFSSEELHERDAKGSCAMKRLAQLFKRQKLEVTPLPDGTAEMRTAKTEPFYEEINKSELAFHWKSFALQHACSEVFRSDADMVHRAMQKEFERLASHLPQEHDDEVQELLRRAVKRGCQASRFCRAARTHRPHHEL